MSQPALCSWAELQGPLRWSLPPPWADRQMEMLGPGREEATPWTSAGWAGVVTILIVFYWSGSRDRRERRKGKRKKTPGMVFSRHTSSKQQAKVNRAKKGKAALPGIPSSWPAASPGKHWTGGSGRSCHSSSACRCVPGEVGDGKTQERTVTQH